MLGISKTRFGLKSLVLCGLMLHTSLAAFAQKDLNDLFKVPGGQSGERGKISIDISPTTAKPGDTVTVSIKMELNPGYYTYSMDKKYSVVNEVDINKIDGFTEIDKAWTPDAKPKIIDDLDLGTYAKFLDSVTWTKKYRIKANFRKTTASLNGLFRSQICDHMTCKPYRNNFDLVVKVELPESKIVKHEFASHLAPTRFNGKSRDPMTFDFALEPKDAEPGDEVSLKITAKLNNGWHIFATDQNPDNTGLPTVVKLSHVTGLKPIDPTFKPNRDPKLEKDTKDKEMRMFFGSVTWTRKFKVNLGVKKGEYGIEGSVRYQVCNEQTCRTPYTVPVALGHVDQADLFEEAEAKVEDHAVTVSAIDKSKGLLVFLLLAVGAGYLALLTPCVFPMIPITVSFFLKQSEKENHRPVFMATVYCLGIVVTFTALGLIVSAIYGGGAVNQLANNAILNLLIAGVLVFFAMNLLGMFEIRVPSWMLSWSSGKESQGGLVGVIFMAVTFTLVSFTCTFAFVGGLMVAAADGEYFWPILGTLAFSMAFASPFFFLALFPSYLQKLPKSGGWMNNIKVTMGMIELAAAFKFLSVADLAWNPVPLLFDFSTVMSAWIVILACTGLYLLNFFRLSHDTPTDNISAIRCLFAMSFLGLAVFIAVGLFGANKPTGLLYENIAAFGPPQFNHVGADKDLGPYIKHDGLKYALDYEKAIAYAKKKNLPVFIDITGVNCINCRKMEKMMEKPGFRKRLEKFVRVQVYVDRIPVITDREIYRKLLEKNIKLQSEWYRDASLPSYAIISPDTNPNSENSTAMLAKTIGYQPDETKFEKFLDAGLEKWQKKNTLVSAPAEKKKNQRAKIAQR